MKKNKFWALLLSAALTVSGSGLTTPGLAGTASASNALQMTERPATVQMPFTVMTGNELTKDMGAGWNLGNTMDGHTGFTPGETVWQPVKTTKKLIKSVHDMGFHTVRIPVTWGTMIDDDNNYEISEAWISRVQDIVDYCISLDMYAIINIHHDGAEQSGWLHIATDDIPGLQAKYTGVWKNIADRFKHYDEHLIFESMNEVKGQHMTVLEENQVIMDLNQRFVDTVRATGSNNAQRWLMVPGKYNYIDSVTNEKWQFSLPDDTVDNRLIVSVHDYSPNGFCLIERQDSSEATLSTLQINQRELKPMYDTYSSKGIPVVVGEYGCINKNNPADRAYYLEGMNRIFQQYKLVGVYWDQGWYDRSRNPDYSFSLIDRNTGESIESEITDAIMRGFFTKGKGDLTDITKNTVVTPFTTITPSANEVSLKSGESSSVTVTTTPTEANDVVLWRSSDERIATVYNGKIHGKEPGTAIITAVAQSGNVTAEITVTVTAADSSVPCTGAAISVDSISLTKGQYTYLDPVLDPIDTDDHLYFSSDDESVALVSPIGKVLACDEGETTIRITASSGYILQVPVQINPAPLPSEVDLSLNVYYNNSSHQYFSNEISPQTISVSRGGQYYLTFDCSTDLSAKAKKAGIDSLSEMTAIYIKDYSVATGAADTTMLESCKIRYDKILVNGKELTLTKTGFKSALKDSGIFDTNDPVNAWDGSVVSEVKVSNYAASFQGITKPTRIVVVFTLSDFCFPNGSVSTDLATLTDADWDEIYKKPASENVTPTPPATTTPKPDASAKPAPAKKAMHGKTYTVGSLRYRVTSVKAGKRTVAVTGAKKKNLKKLTIPSKVKIYGQNFKTTQITAKAFRNYKKLTSVTLPASIKSIGKQAFQNCSKLKTIRLKSKNTKLSNRCLKGIHKKATIIVSKKAKKSYRKKLTGKTGYRKTMKLKTK